MPIRVLDAATIGRIAAGEVVERPSSVAKELIENAIDAGATSITVEIRDGGIEYLRVTDNGSGIAPADARLAFENHATSKIKSGDELTDILTLGFRGEALPSIAAVSKVELTSRQRGAETGVSVRVEGGRFVGTAEAGCPEGTTIVMRDLFFNVPVRKAFLKRGSYEAGLVSDLVSKMTLGNPGISMRLISNGKTQFHGFGDGNMTHAALAVYGREAASELIDIDETEGGLRVRGLLGLGKLARANRSYQSFFVNGRLVRCQLISLALEEACKGRVMIGMHPMCALHVTLPPHSVDVNVHPNKLEIRFRDEQGIRLGLNALFERSLKAQNGMLDLGKLQSEEPRALDKTTLSVALPVENKTEVSDHVRSGQNSPESDDDKQTEVCNKKTEVFNSQTEVHKIETEVCSSNGETPISKPLRKIVQTLPEREVSVLQERFAPEIVQRASPVPPNVPPAALPEQERGKEAPPRMRVIGTAFDTYVFVEIENAVLVIDQHAAHERLLYEKFMTMLETGSAAQQLLTPQVIPVSKREQELLIANQALLYEIGYEIEPFGERDVQVRSVPFVLGRADQRALFMSMLEELDQLKAATLERRRQDIITFSCKRAVKAGDRLTDDEIQALLTDMINSGAPPTCPHGRPVIRKLTKSEIERMFKR